MKNRGQGIKLERKAVWGIVFTVLLIGMLTLAFKVQPVSAGETASIQADGSVDPPTASAAVSSVPETMNVTPDITQRNSTKQFPEPTLEWRCDMSDPDFDDWEPTSNQVMMAPVVADVTGGPNGDPDGYPDIIFTTFDPNVGGPYPWVRNGIIRVIDGRNGAHHYSIISTVHRVIPMANIAVADIDRDGNPEILAITDDTGVLKNRLACYEGNTQNCKWTSDEEVALGWGGGGPTIANIDYDSDPEIIVGYQVWSHDGSFDGMLMGGTGGYLSCVADLNRSGLPEVIAGNSVNGDLYWYRDDLPDGYNAIADFNEDDDPEVVLVGWDETSGITRVWVLDGLTGETLCNCSVDTSTISITGGPPCIADFDGDGYPEIGVASKKRYRVIEAWWGGNWSCTERWSVDIRETSSGWTSSSAFDFDLDGKWDIVYSDEYKLFIFDGETGNIHWDIDNVPSYTVCEMPVIANVDTDTSVEIVVPLNNHWRPGNTGIEVYGNPGWPRAQKEIWNQHTYHITNINHDVTVPANETNNWLRYNNYRAQYPDYGDIPGDANGDGVIDIGDVIYLINYLFLGTSAPDPLWVGDCNCDGIVDIGDVIYLINYLFTGTSPPGCP